MQGRNNNASRYLGILRDRGLPGSDALLLLLAERRESMSQVLKSIPAGSKFGLLVTMEPYPNTRGGNRILCGCSCGATKVLRANNLRNGLSRSCGCLQKALAGQRLLKHGHAKRGTGNTPEYRAWHQMWNRCTTDRAHEAKHYKARGITVCDRWNTFDNFLADMGPRPSSKHSLDRIDNNLGYSPENCRWATRVQQMRNTRRNRYVSANGQRRTLSEWSELTGIPSHTIHSRLRLGFTPEEAVARRLYRRAGAHKT